MDFPIDDNFNLYPPETQGMTRGEYLAYMQKRAAKSFEQLLKKKV
jgi:hypothetical protein